MVSHIEQDQRPQIREASAFQTLLSHVPDAIRFAKLETEVSHETTTPEGKFALTYLFATRNILRPALEDLTKIDTDLLRPVGGAEYNPERTIDEVGVAVVNHLAQQTTDIPNFWLRIEESGKWDRVAGDASITNGERFAIIDPLDMTSSIPKNSRTQTTGIAIYDKAGALLTAGIMSLVDDGFLFIEKHGDTYTVFPKTLHSQYTDTADHTPLRIATLTRRMHALKDTPLIANGQSEWKLDCTSGYAVLSLLQGHVDTVVDPFRGNPWYENVIWCAIAEALGYPVTDKEGKPLDFAKTMHMVTSQEITNGHRMPAIVSRTPDIHNRVLSLLAKPQ